MSLTTINGAILSQPLNDNFSFLNSQINDFLSGYITGREYLIFYHNKLRNNQPVKNLWSGDSTTFGFDITDANFLLDKLSATFLNSCGITSVTSINVGHNSTQTTDWINSFLAADLAQTPDLYVLRWGLNDGDNPVSTRLATFTNALRTGLATIRATRTADQLSVILMMPNSANEAAGRNATWLQLILPVVKQAALDFQCCFIDTYNYLLDSTNVLWQDTPMSDGGVTRIHPLETGNSWIISLMAEALCPTALRNMGVTNVPSSKLIKSVTSAPSTYPFGLSLYRSSIDAPFDGEYFNFRSFDNITLQINSTYTAQTTESIAFRRGLTGTDSWAPWIYLKNSEAYQNLSLVNSWVNFGTSNATAQFKLDSAGNVHIKGMIKNGLISAGVTLATLPSGYRPLLPSYISVLNNGSLGLVQILSTGDIITVTIGSSAWIDFGAISFPAEQ